MKEYLMHLWEIFILNMQNHSFSKSIQLWRLASTSNGAKKCDRKRFYFEVKRNRSTIFDWIKIDETDSHKYSL